jgi:hypothetical protein
MRRGDETPDRSGLHLTIADVQGPQGTWESVDGFLVHWEDCASEPMPPGIRVWISPSSAALNSDRIRGFEIQLGSVPVVVIDRADDGLATFPRQWSIPLAESWRAIPSVVSKLLGPIRAALLQSPLQLADQPL